VAGDRVVFGDDDGYVYCLRTTDGGLWWRYAAKGEVLGAPAIAGGTVFVATSANSVTALDLVSGEWKWLFERPGAKGYTIRGVGSPVVAGGVVHVGFADGFFFALSAADGVELWKNELRAEGRFRDVDATPLIDGDRIYVAGYDDAFYALDRGNGTILWKREGGGVGAAAKLGDAVVFPGSDGYVHVLAAATGEERARFDVTEADFSRQISKYLKRRRLPTAAAVSDGLAIFGSERGPVYFYDPVGKRVVWTFTPGDGVASAPIVAGEYLLFLSQAGYLYCLTPARPE
jgi:outer membrane protein assembly factor BamB